MKFYRNLANICSLTVNLLFDIHYNLVNNNFFTSSLNLKQNYF